MLLTGTESAAVVVAVSASVVLLGLAVFAANVLIDVKPVR